MTRKDLIKLIETYIEKHELSSSLFSVCEQAGAFIMGKTELFNGEVHLAFSVGSKVSLSNVTGEMNGIKFVAVRCHRRWAQIIKVPETDKFVVSTYYVYK